ncbi:MAG TPA: tetratricopeptide repeat protein, partial [Urbifossiella sp.]|nr:tetratricopeptide repeat protein [Urbifossiella sp.]
CQRDPGLAAYWYFQAWQAGLDAVEQDIIRVRAELEAAAENGSAEAQNALGLLLCFGHDDPFTAAIWFERAAEQNHPEALRTLGYLAEGGRGVPKDEARALDCLRRAAELGDPVAQVNLGMMPASIPSNDSIS